MDVLEKLKRFWEGVLALLGAVHMDVASPSFSEAECAKLFNLQCSGSPTALDEQTWSDLMVMPYFERVTEGASIFGKQIVYQRLRTGLDENSRVESGNQVKWLMGRPELLAKLHSVFSGLRTREVEIAALAVSEELGARVPKCLPWARMIPATVLAAGVLAVASPVQTVASVGLIVALGMLLVLFALHMSYVETIRVWDASIESVIQLLVTAAALGGLDEPELEPLRRHRKQAARLARRLTRVQLRIETLDAMRDYFDWFSLGKVRHYSKQIVELNRQRKMLRDAYFLCANLEANCAVARHLLECDRYCWADVGAGRGLELQDVVHPMLPRPMPLTIDSKGLGIFLSGQNGIGKSTLLRTVGINAIAARAFGFCYASRAALPQLSIKSSIHNSDSLLQGESLYISELRRARELLQQADPEWPTLFLVDEVFRGTNYLESVSAAASLLNKLADLGTVIVSSHNLVLGPILANKYISQHVTVDEQTRQLVLRDGVLVETNGLSLLKAHGFDGEFEANAARVFDWLSRYLVLPTHAANVLAG